MATERDAEIEAFVRESNAIEGIAAYKGDPLWDDHLIAANKVAYEGLPDGYALTPWALHRIIMASEPGKFPGEYRQVRVMVGGEEKMPPRDVRPAMRALLERCLRDGTDEDAIWDLHYEFERIHPFCDGNGRTGRLWMNALRQLAGLPWAIVRADDRCAYYNRIRDYERKLGAVRNGDSGSSGGRA